MSSILESKHVMGVLGEGRKNRRVTGWLNQRLPGPSIKFGAQIIRIDSVAKISESPPE